MFSFYKAFIVAVREYKAVVRTKSFLVSILLMPCMMGGSALFQLLLKNQGNTEVKRFAIIDRTPERDLFAYLQTAVKSRNESAIFDPETKKQIRPVFVFESISASANTPDAILLQRFEQSERVRNKEIYGFLEIGVGVYDYQTAAPPKPVALEELTDKEQRDLFKARASSAPDPVVVRYQSDSPMYTSFSRWAEAVVNEAIQTRRFKKAEIGENTVKAILQPVPLVSKDLAFRNSRTGELEDGKEINTIAALGVPVGLILLMFMVIMVWSTPLMQGILEEKTQRIAEVLLGSIQPFALMMGKLLGNVAISVTLACVYLGGAYWAADHFGFSEYLPGPLIAWFVLFQMLGVMLYGSLFIAVGASATDFKESQSLLMPILLVAMIPIFGLINIIREPDSTFAAAMTFFPPSTPMIMMARLAVPPGPPLWQSLLAVATLLAATLACVWAGGRIFRVGILMQGKGARFRDMFRWVLQG